jgi:hypothetical protein
VDGNDGDDDDDDDDVANVVVVVVVVVVFEENEEPTGTFRAVSMTVKSLSLNLHEKYNEHYQRDFTSFESHTIRLRIRFFISRYELRHRCSEMIYSYS